MHSRIWEIDFFRGAAIFLMTAFHLIVDLKDFYNFPFEYFQGFWYYVGKLSAVMFILLAGISTCFSRNVRRHGLQVFGWGMVLTGITYFYNPNIYIRFGILHLLGGSLILYSFMTKFRSWILAALAVFVLILGNIFIYKDVAASYLFPLGLTTTDFISMDYYPLLPWTGIFLTGVVIGRILYGEGRKSLIEKQHDFPLIEFLGRHSLVVYLIHQPLLLLLLLLLHTLVVI